MKQESFTGFMREVMDELRQEERFSTAHIYKYALAAVTDFVGGGEIFFGALTRRWMKRFQEYLEDLQRSYNTISTYVRVIRAVYNRAVDRGLIAGEYRLFAGMKTGVSSERKLAVSAGQMNNLLNKNLRSRLSEDVCEAQDTLALMLLLQGMPYADLVHLHKGNLNGNMLVCHRRKTGTELCVKVLPEAMRLIERYRNRDADSPYLLNMLSGKQCGEAAFHEYRDKLRSLNSGLSRLSKVCGLEGVKVSSYTARHTWATLAKYCQVPEEVISEGLGHSSLDVTRTYLKSFEGDELDKANRLIINYIYSGRKTMWNRG
nr:site-specific integrase [uncultured Bacteroides sp.]